MLPNQITSELLRYLHERFEMPIAERLRIEWHLMVNPSYRRAYEDVVRMHRALYSHFAKPVAPVPFMSSTGWFSLIVIGLVGAGIMSAFLMGQQKSVAGRISTQSPATRSQATSCKSCHSTQKSSSVSPAPKLKIVADPASHCR